LGDRAVTSPAVGTPRRGWWSWVGEGAVAAARGVGFCGLMLAGLGLVLALLLPLLSAGLGIGLLVAGPARWDQTEAVALRVAPFAVMAVSLLLIPHVLLGVRALAILTRRLCGEWCRAPVGDPYRPPPPDERLGIRYRLSWLLGDAAGRRDLLWFTVNACGGWVLAAAPAGLMTYGLLCILGGSLGHPVVAPPPAFPGSEPPVLIALGLALIAFGLWAAPWLLRGYGMLARSMLGPTGRAELALRAAHLAQTRADTLDTGAAEMRRIQRDLHDGAQAQLVAMGMTLDAADQLLDDNPQARALLAEARESSAKALAELRDLVRGIHPPVLADRGLADAVRALAIRQPVRVHVASDLDGRPPAPVEAAAYFTVSELLANISKHAHASQAWVDLRHQDGMLRIGVSDDGTGGADPAHGSGLAGIARRLAAFDGVLALSSPPGGPTVVNVEIPCALSSPKTSSC
jgi:signal transduction histidine kinase